MANPVEIRKVLEVINGDHHIEVLVEFKIPYPRILMHLRHLLQIGLIEKEDNMLWLTSAGQAELAKPPVVRPTSEQGDSEMITRIPRVDLETVHLPKTVVP